jgi:hypothetical protein
VHQFHEWLVQRRYLSVESMTDPRRWTPRGELSNNNQIKRRLSLSRRPKPPTP